MFAFQSELYAKTKKSFFNPKHCVHALRLSTLIYKLLYKVT